MVAAEIKSTEVLLGMGDITSCVRAGERTLELLMHDQTNEGEQWLCFFHRHAVTTAGDGWQGARD